MKIFISGLLLILFFIIMFSSCEDFDHEDDINHKVEPRFGVIIDSVNYDIQKIIKAEKILISGNQFYFNDSLWINISIQLINTEYGPLEKESKRDIGKKVARTVKCLLKDPSQFKRYYVSFVRKDSIVTVFGTGKREETFVEEFICDEL